MQIRTRELFQAIHTEGGLLPPDLLRRLAEADPELEGLTADSYHLDPGDRLGEVISRGWNRLLGAWAAFDAARRNLPDDDTGGQLTRNRWLHVVFDEFGYGRLVSQPAVEIDDKSYPVFTEWNHTPIHMVGCNVALDRRTPGVRGASGQSPHSLVQELLNRSPERLWGMVSNGLRLRLVRDNVALTRQAYVEFDLEAMMIGEAYSDFVVMWLVCHQSRVETERPDECWLECWSKIASEQGARALDALRIGVEEAIATLGRGFLAHPDNHHLHEALRSGTLVAQDYYRQLLRLVYRLLFLFVAEDRDALLDPAADARTRERFLRHYSTQRLRRLADRRRGGRQHDLYTALSTVMEHLGSSSCQPLALPALGSYLWSREALGQLADATVANSELLSAIRDLAWVEEHGVRRVVDFRHLGAEELGSVYESLLELHPELDRETATFTLETSNGNDRKTTGSYYTPTDLITALLDSALEPILDEAAKSADPEAAILELTICDPACGSGHFLIAAANRIGKRLAAIRTGDSEPSPEAMRHALRDVTGSCIYGVDVNPMAVELCKVSLWMEALDPGQPLSFLDHRIAIGNSLLGSTPELIAAGIPASAFKPILGDDRRSVTGLRKRNEGELTGQLAVDLTDGNVNTDAHVIAARATSISAVDDHSLTGVREQQHRFEQMLHSTELRRAALAADIWCAAFVVEKRPDTTAITNDTLARALSDGGTALSPDELAVVGHAKQTYSFLHWHVAFPAVWERGGFDVVLGNPPWDQVQVDPREFFATNAPEIAKAANTSQRERLIHELKNDDSSLAVDYESEQRRIGSIQHFVHSSGRYPNGGSGRLNTAPLFMEIALSLVHPAGLSGLVVPTSIATDSSNQQLFREMLETKRLRSLYDFENRERLFPGVHRSARFALLVTTGRERRVDHPAFIFFAHRVEDFNDQERMLTLSIDQIRRLNPNTSTCPVIRSRRDARILTGMYERVPVIRDQATTNGDLWKFSQLIMFQANVDSKLLRDESSLASERALIGDYVDGEPSYLPLFEAKMLGMWDHRAASIVRSQTATVRQGQPRYLDDEAHSDPKVVSQPRHWVPRSEVDSRLQGRWDRDWLLCVKDVTSASNERTAIGAVIPRVGVERSAPVLMTGRPLEIIWLAAALFSFAGDYAARNKIGGTHLTLAYLEQLPVPSREQFAQAMAHLGGISAAKFSEECILELTFTANDLAPFARDLGYDGPPFRWDPDRRALIRAELDAVMFHLYGIERDDVEYIMETFPIVRRRDEERFDEYRTKRLILERYDAMAAAAASGATYETKLDPPPADSRVAHTTSSTDIGVVIPLPFRRVDNPPESERFQSVVPIYSLKVAAGLFGPSEAVEPEGWASLGDGGSLRVGMFVAEVKGHSMEPRIPDGAWCLFASPIATGPNNGDILLVEHHEISDPDTGGSYAVKRYHSKNVSDDELWENREITLEPLNPDYEPIVLRPEHDDEVRVIAEFVRVIG